MPLEELPEFLTVEEAAAVLRIGRTSAYRLFQQWRLTGGEKGLPVVRLGAPSRLIWCDQGRDLASELRSPDGTFGR